MTKRFQSKEDRNVFFELWKCPLTGIHPLFFAGMLEILDIRFFLQGEEVFYSVTIPRRSVFRLADETYLGALSERLVEEKIAPPSPKHHVWMNKTWKVWGTPFLKELNAQGLLFLDVPKENHFQYLIWTEDESPEFISLKPPKIDVFPKGDRIEVIKTLLDRKSVV